MLLSQVATIKQANILRKGLTVVQWEYLSLTSLIQKCSYLKNSQLNHNVFLSLYRFLIQHPLSSSNNNNNNNSQWIPPNLQSLFAHNRFGNPRLTLPIHRFYHPKPNQLQVLESQRTLEHRISNLKWSCKRSCHKIKRKTKLHCCSKLSTKLRIQIETAIVMGINNNNLIHRITMCIQTMDIITITVLV